MKIEKADKAGACYGVKRALKIAEDLISLNTSASTLGPLIHNPQVVNALKEDGLEVADTLDDIEGNTVVIRSHGVTPETFEKLSRRGLDIVDATCPHVSRAQQGASELAESGCRVLVVGEAGHPEVEGLVAYARQGGGAVDVVLDPTDIPQDIYAPIGVVVQTTQKKETLQTILDELRARSIDPIVKDTICSATQLRQTAALDLAARSDAMIVIGGRNSSNTTRLAEICKSQCENTFHIESAEELDQIDISGCNRVGITAGASTPESQIDEAIQYLEHRYCASCSDSVDQ